MPRRAVALWLAVGWAGYALLPWSAIGGTGFFSFQWISLWPRDVRAAPALFALLLHGRLWLLPLAVALLLPLLLWFRRFDSRTDSWIVIASGVLGLASILGVALAIDIEGW